MVITRDLLSVYVALRISVPEKVLYLPKMFPDAYKTGIHPCTPGSLVRMTDRNKSLLEIDFVIEEVVSPHSLPPFLSPSTTHFFSLLSYIKKASRVTGKLSD